MKNITYLFLIILMSFTTLLSQNNNIDEIDLYCNNIEIPSFIRYRDIVVHLHNRIDDKVLIENNIIELEKSVDSLSITELKNILSDRNGKWKNCVISIKNEMNKFMGLVKNKERDKYRGCIEELYKKFISLSCIQKQRNKPESFHNILYYMENLCSNEDNKKMLDLLPEIKNRRNLYLEWKYVNINKKYFDLSDQEISDREIRFEKGKQQISNETDALISDIINGNINEIKKRINLVHTLYHQNEDILVQDFIE